MKFIILSLFFVFQCSATYAQEVVTFQSNWNGKPITLEAELHLPKNAQAPYPTIVTIHGSGPDVRLSLIDGKSDIRSVRLRDTALSMGYAVVVMDVFTKRKLKRVNEDPTQIPHKVGASDTKALLRVLSKDNRLDKNNVFFTGHSWGGMVAYRLMHKSVWNENDPILLKGIVADAPGCKVLREGDSVTTDSLITVGSRDERTPAAGCLRFENMYKDSGKIRVHIIANMDHSFSTAGSVWSAAAASPNGCAEHSVIRKSDGRLFFKGKEISVGENVCLTKGAWVDGNKALLDHNVEIALEFFNNLKTAALK
jgi:dienelactone hydrolase